MIRHSSCRVSLKVYSEYIRMFTSVCKYNEVIWICFSLFQVIYKLYHILFYTTVLTPALVIYRLDEGCYFWAFVLQLGTREDMDWGAPIVALCAHSVVMSFFVYRSMRFKTNCGLVTPYGSFKFESSLAEVWLGAWRHRAIAWTNFDLSSVRFSDIHLKAVSRQIPQPSITKISMKIIILNLHWNLSGAHES